ncbi:ubiE/COQ5 methyltransferase [Ophiocordyceps camponoti-floridani]|uniref:UbiE/COQ5 methyltransferase n=1 Tax=Ophiocordyceps camponoti-floridani TaxID=2030778 RepID=A0A8H4VFE2_9HYPO|nr:ubiE/COQ5 methyltransferase [Ophiocordyceps camponoti-floridani]
MEPVKEEHVYSTDHSDSVLRTHRWRTLANSAGYLLPHLLPDMMVLDVGCGPGSITIDLARAVPEGHVTGVEYVSDPLDGARADARAQAITNVSFSVADAHHLPFPDASFHVVHAHQVLQHLADPVQALREMRRVVRPGGLVACRESASMTWHPESKGIEAWLQLTTRVAREKGGNPHPGSRIHVWAEQAGFATESIDKSAGAWNKSKLWLGMMLAIRVWVSEPARTEKRLDRWK